MTTRPAQPIRVHAFDLSGHVHRVVLALSLLDLPFEQRPVDLFQREQKSPAFLALNPFGEVPVIEDGEVVLADSNAILVYLATRYDAARTWLPADALGAARVQRWLSVAAGELRAGPARARWTATFLRQPVPEEMTATALRLFTLIEAQLQQQPFLAAAHPTLADIALYAYTAAAPEGRLSLEPYPQLRGWLARVEALPGFVPMRRTPVPEAA